MMSDVYCFTCSHEIRQTIDGSWVHIDGDDERLCVCIADELGCQP